MSYFLYGILVDSVWNLNGFSVGFCELCVGFCEFCVRSLWILYGFSVWDLCELCVGFLCGIFVNSVCGFLCGIFVIFVWDLCGF